MAVMKRIMLDFGKKESLEFEWVTVFFYTLQEKQADICLSRGCQ